MSGKKTEHTFGPHCHTGVTLKICQQLMNFNPLMSKRSLLYLKIQSLPRCKHFPSRL